MKKLWLGIGIGIFLALAAVGIFGEHGLLKYFKLREERRTLEKEKQTLEQENYYLSQQIELLKDNLRYLEQVARKKLGMIGPEEVIIKLPEEHSGAGSEEQKGSSQTPLLENPK